MPKLGDSIAEALELRQIEGRPVRVGLIGAGPDGHGHHRPDRADDRHRGRGRRRCDPRQRVRRARDRRQRRRSNRAGRRQPPRSPAPSRAAGSPSCASYRDVCTAEGVDVVIDATGNPNVGAEVALATIAAGKHIVMMNVEADVTIGAYLAARPPRPASSTRSAPATSRARRWSSINFVRGLGYPIVAAGKGKNNAFNIDATPDAYVEEAKRRNMNPRMLVEFVDGSKTMVEMVAIANATGLVPDIPGMHGPSAPLGHAAQGVLSARRRRPAVAQGRRRFHRRPRASRPACSSSPRCAIRACASA